MAKVQKNNLYVTGFEIARKDGSSLLKRNKISYNNSTTDDESYTIKEGDYLWDIAYIKYGDSKLWWVIADFNSIYNPLELTVGQIIILPSYETISALI